MYPHKIYKEYKKIDFDGGAGWNHRKWLFDRNYDFKDKLTYPKPHHLKVEYSFKNQTEATMFGLFVI